MGFKAKLRNLNQILEMRNNLIQILYAAIKAVIMEKGDTEDGDWVLRIPLISPNEINAKYQFSTDMRDDYLIMRVTRKESNGDLGCDSSTANDSLVDVREEETV